MSYTSGAEISKYRHRKKRKDNYEKKKEEEKVEKSYVIKMGVFGDYKEFVTPVKSEVERLIEKDLGLRVGKLEDDVR